MSADWWQAVRTGRLDTPRKSGLFILAASRGVIRIGACSNRRPMIPDRWASLAKPGPAAVEERTGGARRAVAVAEVVADVRAVAEPAAARGGGGTGGGKGGSRRHRWRRKRRRHACGKRGWKRRRRGNIDSARLPTITLNPNANPQLILPKLPESATTNQQVMFMLADGTGGFVIHDTNDLAGGLDKIGKEMNEHYVLGYTPDESEEGSCHTLPVKVDRGGTIVRARSGYCNVKPRDLLAGNPIEKTLEARATSGQAGNIAASMQLPFFYTGTNTARVNVAMEIPAGALKFTKEKGKFRGEMNVLGIAAKADGTVGARFSDTVKFEFPGKKEMEAFQENPYHYENQFDIASGQYNLKVVFSSASDSFGKIEMPLTVDAYDSKQFGLSGIAFSKAVLPSDR